jgi:anti-sigma factor (TIGR02949 family)
MTTHGHTSAECREMLRQINEYIDGELEAASCAELETHLAGCQDCRVVVDTTRRTVTLFRRHTPLPGLPPDVQHRLVQVLEREGCLRPE